MCFVIYVCSYEEYCDLMKLSGKAGELPSQGYRVSGSTHLGTPVPLAAGL